LSAVPFPKPGAKKKKVLLSGEVADPSNAPPGCAFHPRCAYAEDRCRQDVPELIEIEPGHHVRCHLAKELTLEGMPDIPAVAE
jgi:oligopeptide/dipeptide ABC transporter ATP-binding protein